MMKSILVMSVLALTLSATVQAKTKSKPKLSKEDARELCLTTKGAGMAKKELKKCTSKAMRTGKV